MIYTVQSRLKQVAHLIQETQEMAEGDFHTTERQVSGKDEIGKYKSK